MECEILDVAKAGQLVDQTEQSPKSAFLTAQKGQIYSRAECINRTCIGNQLICYSFS